MNENHTKENYRCTFTISHFTASAALPAPTLMWLFIKTWAESESERNCTRLILHCSEKWAHVLAALWMRAQPEILSRWNNLTGSFQSRVANSIAGGWTRGGCRAANISSRCHVSASWLTIGPVPLVTWQDGISSCLMYIYFFKCSQWLSPRIRRCCCSWRERTVASWVLVLHKT